MFFWTFTCLDQIFVTPCTGLDLKFWRTNARRVRHGDEHIYSKRPRSSSASYHMFRKVRKANIRDFPNEIPIRNAHWFRTHFRKFCSSADWLESRSFPICLHGFADNMVCRALFKHKITIRYKFRTTSTSLKVSVPKGVPCGCEDSRMRTRNLGKGAGFEGHKSSKLEIRQNSLSSTQWFSR